MTVTTVFAGNADGVVTSTNAVYATARSGGTLTSDISSVSFDVGQYLSGGNYTIIEGFFGFDTSPIADTDTISAVVLSLFAINFGDSPGSTQEVYARDWGVSLTTADYVAAGSISGLTLVASLAPGSYVLNAYNAFAENGTNFRSAVDKAGTTRIMVSAADSRTSNAPVGFDAATWNFANAAGTTNDPKLVVTSSAALNNYTLTAAQGSFALTGQAVSLLANHRLNAATGSFTLTGEPVTFPRSYRISAGAGSFALSGQDVSLQASHRLTAASGSFTLTGEPVALVRTSLLGAGAGSFVLTGESVTFPRTYRLATGVGSFTLTGQAAALVHTTREGADVGSFTLTGQAVSLRHDKVLTAASGSFTLSGQDANLQHGDAPGAYRLSAETGSFTLTGQAAALRYTPQTVVPDVTGAFGTGLYGDRTSPPPPTTLRHFRLAAGAGRFALQGRPLTFRLTLAPIAHLAPPPLPVPEPVVFAAYRLAAGSGKFRLRGGSASLVYVEQLQPRRVRWLRFFPWQRPVQQAEPLWPEAEEEWLVMERMGGHDGE